MLFIIMTLIIPFQEEKEIDLDLNAVMELAAISKDVEEFEKRLNTQDVDNIFNNLDMNADGEIDYIAVEEERSGSFEKGQIRYRLFVDEAEIATVDYEFPDEDEIEKTRIVVIGHPHFYGPGFRYTHWVHFRHHPFWHGPYWKRGLYRSPHRYQRGVKRTYPNYWKRQKIENRNIYKKRQNQRMKKLNYQNKKLNRQNQKLKNKIKNMKQ